MEVCKGHESKEGKKMMAARVKAMVKTKKGK